MSKASGEFAPWHGVFETLRVIRGRPLFVAAHRAELQRAMDELGLTREVDFAAEAAALPRQSGRWRWIVTREETQTRFDEEKAPSEESMAVGVSPVRVGSANWDARFKTLSYLAHAQAAKLIPGGEGVLLNEHGHVASASRGNIFWRRRGRLYTPAHEAGCRCGVVRAFVLEREGTEVGHFPLEELLAADEVFLTNSMRGIVTVGRLEGRVLPALETAVRLRAAYDDEVARQLAPTSSSPA